MLTQPNLTHWINCQIYEMRFIHTFLSALKNCGCVQWMHWNHKLSCCGAFHAVTVKRSKSTMPARSHRTHAGGYIGGPHSPPPPNTLFRHFSRPTTKALIPGVQYILLHNWQPTACTVPNSVYTKRKSTVEWVSSHKLIGINTLAAFWQRSEAGVML